MLTALACLCDSVKINTVFKVGYLAADPIISVWEEMDGRDCER
jgi:hypothetical protein